MTKPRTTAGKRNIQTQKREKAQAKQERKAARRAEDTEVPAAPLDVDEAGLIEELAQIHAALEAGDLSLVDFESRRDGIRQQLQQIDRLDR